MVKKYKIYASKSVFMTLCAKPVKKPTPAPATKNGIAGLLIFNITWYAVIKRLVKFLDVSLTVLIMPLNLALNDG